MEDMKPPLFVRPISPEERQAIRAGLRSPEAFTLRRGQILAASADGQRPAQIARALGCAVQTVRDAIRAFHAEGIACLHRKSTRPHRTRLLLDPAGDRRLRDLLHRSPRDFGKPTGTWTLRLAAEACRERGLTDRPISTEAIRRALGRLGVRWRRAKHWITSPDPAYARKKRSRDRLIRLAEGHPDWVLGFQDETWWSRLARPAMHAWAGVEPLRLGQLETTRDDPDPKALCCYGLLRADTRGMLVRFVDGRPVSQVTEDFLAWACERLAAEGKKALLLVWDNASWHVSRRVRAWIKAHNRSARRDGGVRIVACYLPVKAPWLNAIEPCWIHGKRAILEPDRKLTAAEVKERVCEHFGCELFDPIAQKVA
jgi:transposase